MDEFDILFKVKAHMIYRFLLSLCGDCDLAAEITSETFYRAYLNIDKFRNDCSIESWLCCIAKNALLKEQKRRNRNMPDSYMPEKQDNSLYASLADKETAIELHKCLHRLSEPYREVFQLRVFAELRFKDIADVFGKNESWAKVTYYRAKSKLIKELNDK